MLMPVPESQQRRDGASRSNRQRCRITSMTVSGNPYRYHTHRLDLEDPSIHEWAASVLADPDQGIDHPRCPQT
jgi:hypothetical protein